MNPAPLTLLASGPGWVVIAKPPGLVVHRNIHTRREPAALQLLRDQLGRTVYPIHRLDRGASGCVIFATDRDLAGALAVALAEGTKTYVALVRGACGEPSQVTVDRPLVDDTGREKEARTHLACVARCLEPSSSLVVARPVTGRYHQIRRHLRGLSHPILGDRQHGDGPINRTWRADHGLCGLALHALAVTFEVPGQGPQRVVCPLFADLHRLLSGLPLWSAAIAALPELALAPLASG